MVIIFNLLGLGMMGLGILAFFAISRQVRISDDPLFMLVAGPIMLLCDVIYRWKHPNGHWIKPSGSGQLFFVPVWVFGMVWIVLGADQYITGRGNTSVLAYVILGVIALFVLWVFARRSVVHRLNHSKARQFGSASFVAIGIRRKLALVDNVIAD